MYVNVIKAGQILHVGYIDVSGDEDEVCSV